MLIISRYPFFALYIFLIFRRDGAPSLKSQTNFRLNLLNLPGFYKKFENSKFIELPINKWQKHTLLTPASETIPFAKLLCFFLTINMKTKPERIIVLRQHSSGQLNKKNNLDLSNNKFGIQLLLMLFPPHN